MAHLLTQFNNIDHIKRIRIHTRLPIVLPARITDNLISVFNKSHKQLVMVVHCNHANELNALVIAALQQLKQQGMSLFNQSVLLKNINDNAKTLAELSEALFSVGVIPYYLHQLDKAVGTGHFEVPEQKSLEIIQQLQTLLPGYLVPKLVKEVAGAEAKQALIA
jgi:KamA family protein